MTQLPLLHNMYSMWQKHTYVHVYTCIYKVYIHVYACVTCKPLYTCTIVTKVPSNPIFTYMYGWDNRTFTKYLILISIIKKLVIRLLTIRKQLNCMYTRRNSCTFCIPKSNWLHEQSDQIERVTFFKIIIFQKACFLN